MNNYQRINTRKPKSIENKRAFLIGSGIASLAAAEYLMRDGHMKGNQITIFEQDNVSGGAMDGAGNPEDGFIVRGGREMEKHYECALPTDWQLQEWCYSISKLIFKLHVRTPIYITYHSNNKKVKLNSVRPIVFEYV